MVQILNNNILNQEADILKQIMINVEKASNNNNDWGRIQLFQIIGTKKTARINFEKWKF